MISKHNHTYNGCNHNLQHCTHCDVVYCTKCSKEWSSTNYAWSFLKDYEYNKKTTPYYVGDDLSRYNVVSLQGGSGGHSHA